MFFNRDFTCNTSRLLQPAIAFEDGLCIEQKYTAMHTGIIKVPRRNRNENKAVGKYSKSDS